MAGLESLEGKVVRVYRGGPKFKAGLLLDVRKDYLVLWNEEEGVQYIVREHVQSFCEDKMVRTEVSREEETRPKYVKANSICECLSQLEYLWVRVNDGPEAIEGIITDVNDEYFVMVCGSEVRIVYVCHLKAISVGPKPEKKGEDKGEAKKGEAKKDGEKPHLDIKGPETAQGDTAQGQTVQGEKQPDREQNENVEGRKPEDHRSGGKHPGGQNDAVGQEKEGPQGKDKKAPR